MRKAFGPKKLQSRDNLELVKSVQKPYYTERDSRIGSGLRESPCGSTIIRYMSRLAIVEPQGLSRSPEPILESRSVYVHDQYVQV
jgi:hypothetical protein